MALAAAAPPVPAEAHAHAFPLADAQAVPLPDTDPEDFADPGTAVADPTAAGLPHAQGDAASDPNADAAPRGGSPAGRHPDTHRGAAASRARSGPCRNVPPPRPRGGHRAAQADRDAADQDHPAGDRPGGPGGRGPAAPRPFLRRWSWPLLNPRSRHAA
ncbi:hypothetical protein KCMC57_up10710 [Kitasatospora sp. CMC57]|uniref:Uncharacterized protein n=1 Tax=Kitasatospora sp. CMC57 TaxID=3231513 RepID=A0AB33JTT4_9ACTN